MLSALSMPTKVLVDGDFFALRGGIVYFGLPGVAGFDFLVGQQNVVCDGD